MTSRAWTWSLGLAMVAFPSCERMEVSPNLDDVAESYVRLVLAVGEHDPDYVDAYYGPEEWREEVRARGWDLTAIRGLAEGAVSAAEAADVVAGDELLELRRRFLLGQLRSLLARVDLLGGAAMSFDEESRALYEAVAPRYPEEHFLRVLDELDTLVPGEGSLEARYRSFRDAFVIPAERLEAVFSAAIDACRERTRQHLDLPTAESFEVEYVSEKPWSAYNWYRGGFHSLIQVNTDLPIYLDRAIDLACHEGYPGHHVYNALLEKSLVEQRGWVEYTVYPLFSPQSLIAEGTANYGIEVAFPGEEREAFERDVLFPLAGLDPELASVYRRIRELMGTLDHAGNDVARRYLEGRIDRETAARELARFSLWSMEQAEQRVRFIDKYRTYVINYNLGEDLVRAHVESAIGESPSAEQRWQAFGRLLASPRLPSDL